MNHTIIITTVGTSMFTNFLEKSKNSILREGIWKDIKDKSYTKEEYIRQGKKLPFQSLIKAVEEGLNNNLFSCAELDTITQIIKKYGDNVEHHLLCSETIAGYLAGQILERKIENIKSNEMIKKLQTHIAEGFKETVFLDLIRRIQSITIKYNLIEKSLEVLSSKDGDKIKKYRKEVIKDDIDNEPFKTLFTKPNGSWADFVDNKINDIIIILKLNKVIINYSGGYKAIIPYLTILGQLYNYDLAYVHEDSKELIDVKPLPISFDVSLAEQYYPYLDILSYQIKENFALSEIDLQLTKEVILKKAKIQVEEMKDYQLIDELNEITAFGTLILNYIREKNAISKSTLGHYCEYKMFEYFYDYYRQDYIKIERSFKPKKDDKRNIGINYIGDADLRLDINENQFDWIEIKAFGGVLEIKNNEWRVIQRIRDRHNYKTENFEGNQIRKYKFIFYKYENDSLELLQPIIDKIIKEFSNVEVYYFEIKLNENSSAFSSFMQDKMKKNELLKYNPQKNKWD